jgi:hypothetical protein
MKMTDRAKGSDAMRECREGYINDRAAERRDAQCHRKEALKLFIEREDLDDGSITYHLWEEGGHWIIGLNDAPDEVGSKAREYAETIVKAVNKMATESAPPPTVEDGVT